MVTTARDEGRLATQKQLQKNVLGRLEVRAQRPQLKGVSENWDLRLLNR